MISRAEASRCEATVSGIELLLECPKGNREVVTLAVGTGMRLDELVHLRWADIDLERRLVAVHRGRHGTTKSGKARYIPILDSLMPFEQDYHRVSFVVPDTGTVYALTRRKQPAATDAASTSERVRAA